MWASKECDLTKTEIEVQCPNWYKLQFRDLDKMLLCPKVKLEKKNIFLHLVNPKKGIKLGSDQRREKGGSCMDLEGN